MGRPVQVSIESREHINYLELKAVLLALQPFASAERNQHIMLLVDHVTAIAYPGRNVLEEAIGPGSPDMSFLCLLLVNIFFAFSSLLGNCIGHVIVTCYLHFFVCKNKSVQTRR